MPRIIAQNRIARVPIASRSITYSPDRVVFGLTKFALQAETVTYINALRAAGNAIDPPTVDDVNTLIYHWKRLGAWSVLLGGYIFCIGANSNGLLMNMRRDLAIYDALQAGNPPWTPNKGFGGGSWNWSANTSQFIEFPIPGAVIGNSGGATPQLFGGVLQASAMGSAGPVISARNNLTMVAGVHRTLAPYGFMCGGSNASNASFTGDGFAVLGCNGGTAAGGQITGGFSATGNQTTGLKTANPNQGMLEFAAYFVFQYGGIPSANVFQQMGWALQEFFLNRGVIS